MTSKVSKVEITIDQENGNVNIDTGDVGVVTLMGVAQLLQEVANRKLNDEISKNKPTPDKVTVE